MRQVWQDDAAQFLAVIGPTTTFEIPHNHHVDCVDLWELGYGSRGVPQDTSQRFCILALREEKRSQWLRWWSHVSSYVPRSLKEIITSGNRAIQSKLRVCQHFGRRAAPL